MSGTRSEGSNNPESTANALNLESLYFQWAETRNSNDVKQKTKQDQNTRKSRGINAGLLTETIRQSGQKGRGTLFNFCCLVLIRFLMLLKVVIRLDGQRSRVVRGEQRLDKPAVPSADAFSKQYHRDEMIKLASVRFWQCFCAEGERVTFSILFMSEGQFFF